MSHFTIKCRNCGEEIKDIYHVSFEHCKNALLITKYADRKFGEDKGQGLWAFNWLPVHDHEFAQAGPVVYRSKGLSSYLGLENLYIAFSGYWPEMNAMLQTCTFKEFEAAVVIQNAMESNVKGLIVASAGNTARAFAYLSVVADFPVIIIVPMMCLTEMWYLESSSKVPTLAVGDGDFSDSIDVARRISRVCGFPFEGGAKNMAKRDGLGTVLLKAVSEMDRLPDHYFQAVGSGAGAIGVWEMSERFVLDGRFGPKLPRLHLGQNFPFGPMVKAWWKKSSELDPEDLRPELIGQITTRVLSTRYPAYSVKGGLYDALKATDGMMYGIQNDEVFSGMDLFEKTEGIDIVPAAGVAVAALREAVNIRAVRSVDSILLNITGGGEKRLGREKKVSNVEPRFISKKITETEIEEFLCKTLKKN